VVLRRTLALGPDHFAGHQVNGLEAAIFTIAVGAGPDGGVDARRQKRPFARRRGNEIHAGFDQGYVEDLGVGIVRRRDPILGAARMGADHDRVGAAGGDNFGVDCFGASFGIDGGDDVLKTQVD